MLTKNALLFKIFVVIFAFIIVNKRIVAIGVSY